MPARLAPARLPAALLTLLALAQALPAPPVFAQAAPTPTPTPTISRFELPTSGPVLRRATHAGSFFDVVGRRSAVFGYENRGMEAWVYPLKLYDDLGLHFAIDDYPVPVAGTDVMRRIEVRPEATTLVYTHPAFTVRQVIFAPIDETGVVHLLDVETARPLHIDVSFRPDLSLMWPGGLGTGFVGFDYEARRYFTGEETQTYYGLIGSPAAVDRSVQPYQEEPRDVPNRFRIRLSPKQAAAGYVPIVTAASVTGRADAEATYDKLLDEAERLYGETVDHYRRLEQTVRVTTPDERLNEAYRWCKIGMDKGLATNPALGTGLVAGYRTSGNSERPGFAWFFGRDALWTALGTTAVGDYATTRQALDFLARWQRADGKVPHEISQSAHLVDWFEAFVYPWASADASPLFAIVLADYYRHTGDTEFLRKHLPAAERAYGFSAATDADGDGLYENTGVGHAWVEGGLLYPPHEELYLQGLMIQAARDVAEMRAALGEPAAARRGARPAAPAPPAPTPPAPTPPEATLAAVEALLWLPDAGHYAFGTALADAPDLSEAQRPISEADNKENTKKLEAGTRPAGPARVVPANTALQGVPLWWGLLDTARAQGAITAYGQGSVSTDWGARLLDKDDPLYDPMSYHNGSVWPLFTGWTSMGAYAYGRPHVGYQGLMATALLTRQDALGYVTELLSGDFNTAFGRSSHHQVWSEAMVASPLIRGLLGAYVEDGGQALRLSPKLPADWDSVRVAQLPVGDQAAAVTLRRETTRTGAQRFVATVGGLSGKTLRLAPAFPRDARVTAVRANGRAVAFDTLTLGDVLLVEAEVGAAGETEVAYELARRGSDVAVRHEPALPGASNGQVRVLRSVAGEGALVLTVEGRTGATHELRLVSDRAAADVSGATLEGDVLRVAFEGTGDAEGWVRREVRVGWR